LILLASIASVELGLSVALTEIVWGLPTTPWIDDNSMPRAEAEARETL
jgi:hypothetical protein